MIFKARTISRERTRLNDLSMVGVERKQDWIRDSFTGKVEAAIFFRQGSAAGFLGGDSLSHSTPSITVARNSSLEALMMDLISLKSIQIASF